MAKLSVEQALLRANSLAKKGEVVEARNLYELVLKSFPNNKRAQQGLAAITNRVTKAVTQSPAIKQIDALIALYNSGRFEELVVKAKALVDQHPSSFVVWNILAAGQKALGRLAEAESGFRKAAELNPAYAEAYYNMGNTLRLQDKFDEAIAAYHRALKINPNHVNAHYNIGVTLEAQFKYIEAIAAYRSALEIEPTKAEVINNIGNALKAQGELDEAIAAYHRALEIKPAYAEAHCNMGVTLYEQGKLDEAIAAYQCALGIKPAYAAACYNMGIVLHEQGKLDEAIAAYHRALEIKPAYAIAAAHILHQKQHICDYSVAEKLRDASTRLGIETDAVPPFAALSWEDHPRQHESRAVNWARQNYKQLPLPLPVRPKMQRERLKIGYFSADFHDHATMFLMAGLLREHNKGEFELFAYSYGRSKAGDWRKKAEGDVDHFFDVTDCSDREIVDLARSHGLDVAIDLKGYTTFTRSSIFQYRIAPIQMNYLGYPGTMGADFIDYIIADPVVIPNDQREFYSEQVIYLPHTYQPNDDTREIAEIHTTRSDFGLPEDTFVFCCFNNSYKISPREFEIWMRLLKQVDGSVLWLLKSNKWAEENLRKEVQLRGIDPERLVFAEKVSHAEHLARHKHADLFVDTFNYNAHTTASDALWGGLPVVTKQGKQFAARVAASLLNAVGLPELITETEEDYERLILELATQPERLSAINGKLAENRLSEPLFDTKRYTRDFERGLKAAYNLYFEGNKPADIWVREDEV